MFRFYLTFLMTSVFFLISTAIFLVVVAPCALSKFSWSDQSCELTSTPKEAPNLDQIANLEHKLKLLKSDLLSEQCAYNAFNETPVADLPSAEPTVLTSEEEEGFAQQDLSKLAGCWEFTGSAQIFSPKDRDYPQASSSNAYYCFNPEGRGDVKTEIDGNFCTGEIIAKFDGSGDDGGALEFAEITDQNCPRGTKFSDGSPIGFIISRTYSCTLIGQLGAQKIACETVSSYDGYKNKIVLKRAN